MAPIYNVDYAGLCLQRFTALRLPTGDAPAACPSKKAAVEQSQPRSTDLATKLAYTLEDRGQRVYICDIHAEANRHIGPARATERGWGKGEARTRRDEE